MSFMVSSRWSDVYLDAGARLLAQTGMTGAMTALLLLLQSNGAGGIAVAALTVAVMLPSVVLAPLTGRLADRIDSRVLIVIAGLIRAVVSVALTMTTAPTLVVALVVTLSIGTAILQPTLGALIPEMVTREDLPRASAIAQSAAIIGMMAGPALAGLLVGFFDTAAALWMNAVCALATVVAGMLIKTRRGREREETTGDEKANRRPWSIATDPIIRLVTIGLAAIVGVVSAVNVIEVFFVRETLGASEVMYGIVGTAWAAGMAVGAWFAGRIITEATSDRRLVVWLFAWLGSTTVAVGIMATVYGSAWWLVPLMATGGLFNGAQNTALGVLFGRRVPAAVRGRAQATLMGRVQATSLIGFVAAGFALELLSPRAVAAICSIGGLVILAALVPWLRRALLADRVAERSAATARVAVADVTA
ncbi:MFS transporter [Stackebrandtia soli]|uniref:MFS transporter n=1 Tax=Stackebrandtia soli TaxID=1892856 RepID=UPI0039EA3456